MNGHKSDGYVLILALTSVVIVGLMAGSMVFSSTTTTRATGDERSRTQAFYAAQSGLERTTKRLTQLAASMTPTPASPEAAANALIIPATYTGNIGTGRFTATVTKRDVTATTAVLRVKSEGTDQLGLAGRDVSTDVQINLLNGNAGAYAPSALMTTGNVKDNGNAPIAGVKVTNPITRIFTCSAPSTGSTTRSPCMATVGGLNTYTLDTPVNATSLVKPVVGELVRDGAGNRFVVQKVTQAAATMPTTATVVLAALNENPSAANPVAPMNTNLLAAPSVSLIQTDMPAISAPNGSTLANPSNNTAGVCGVYGCPTYSFPPSVLFQLAFGVTKDEMLQRLTQLGAYFNQAVTSGECNAHTVIWVKSTDFNNTCTTSPSSPKVVILDARAAASGTVQISTAGAFYGLIYVMSNTEVKLAGNGSFVGSVISEAGIDPNASENDSSSVTGNGSSVCPAVSSRNGQTTYAKVCYNATVIGNSSAIVTQSISQFNVAKLPNSWAEYAR